MSPTHSPGSPATLSDRLDAIFDRMHDGLPDGVRLCDLMAPCPDPDNREPEDESTGSIYWYGAGDVKFDCLGNVEEAVVEALRGLADEIAAAATRIEEGCR